MKVVRYRVRARFTEPALLGEFTNWMKSEHGADLLSVPGCIEFRVFRMSDLELNCEYLFESQKHLDTYLAQLAPGLREKGMKRFPSGVTYERDVSSLVARGRNYGFTEI